MPMHRELQREELVCFPGFRNPGLKSAIPLELTSLVFLATPISRPFEDPGPGNLIQIQAEIEAEVDPSPLCF